ncbi:unnamed protein product [Somion occarium]|uniref:Uncharacterized protein n=1 Tax=Somion occarium TaxID=3059160 RepID=A0ABP1E0Z0_9APHY
MHPTFRLGVHKPLIRFIGKRQWPSKPEPQHPHPFAPAELKKAFSDFVSKFQSSGAQAGLSSTQPATSQPKSGPNVHVYQEFWQAPERLWKSDLSEEEVELAMSGGASRY